MERAFRLYDRNLAKGIREALEAGAEVVRPTAESLAVQTLKPPKNVDWTLMRVGVTRRTGYVAPVERGRFAKGGKIGAARYRRGEKFTAMMLGRALEPALDQNVPRVEQEFEDALRDLARQWSRV